MPIVSPISFSRVLFRTKVNRTPSFILFAYLDVKTRQFASEFFNISSYLRMILVPLFWILCPHFLLQEVLHKMYSYLRNISVPLLPIVSPVPHFLLHESCSGLKVNGTPSLPHTKRTLMVIQTIHPSSSSFKNPFLLSPS